MTFPNALGAKQRAEIVSRENLAKSIEMQESLIKNDIQAAVERGDLHIYLSQEIHEENINWLVGLGYKVESNTCPTKSCIWWGEEKPATETDTVYPPLPYIPQWTPTQKDYYIVQPDTIPCPPDEFGWKIWCDLVRATPDIK